MIMWVRADLKNRAKVMLRRNYWMVVLVAFILSVVNGNGRANFNLNFNFDSDTVKSEVQEFFYDSGIDSGYDGYEEYYEYEEPDGVAREFAAGLLGMMGAMMVGIGVIAILLSVLLSTFLINPLVVGIRRFLMVNREAKPELSELGFGFKNGAYKNVVKVMFMSGLYIFLWSLLFIIPGIVKAYQYRMVPYMLAENPNIDYRRALDLSRQTMNGQKGETFILDLSFIGWEILSALTCGILGIFYVNPYVQTTDAEWYAVMREHALYNQYSNRGELPGFVMYYQNMNGQNFYYQDPNQGNGVY